MILIEALVVVLGAFDVNGCNKEPGDTVPVDYVKDDNDTALATEVKSLARAPPPKITRSLDMSL